MPATAKRVKRPPPVADLVPTNKRFIFKAEVLERIGVTYPCLWQWMRDGEFPMAREVGGQCAWLESEIDAWMSSRPVRRYKSREVA